MSVYRVYPDGDDSGDGLTRPWQTFRRAVEAANAGTIGADDHVRLAGDLSEPKTLHLRASGRPDAPLVIEGEPGACLQWPDSVATTRLWAWGAWLVFSGIRFVAPRVTRPVLNRINADWLLRLEPASGGAHHVLIERCAFEGVGAFKSTGLNTFADTTGWGARTIVRDCDFLISGCAVDWINLEGARLTDCRLTMSGAGSSSLAVQTKGGCRRAFIAHNTLRLTDGAAQYGFILGGGSEWNPDRPPAYIYDPAGHEGYNHLAYDNLVVMDAGASFTWGAIAMMGAKDSAAIGNQIIGSGGGRGVHLARAYWGKWQTATGYALTVNPTLLGNRISGVEEAYSEGEGVVGVVTDERAA